MHTLNNACALEVVDYHFLVLAAFAVEYQLCNAGLVGSQLNAFVDIPVCMACNGDGLFPVLHSRAYAGDGYRRAEHCAVKDRTDGAVRALPHLVELVLVHALVVGGDGGALHGHAILLGGFCRVDGYLVAGLVALGQTEVVVLCFQLNEGHDKLFLNHFPQDAGHLVAIHLNERSGHLDFFFHVNVWFKVSNDSLF